MAEQIPLVIIGGQIQQLPTGDTVTGGGGGGVSFDAVVTIWNNGDPQLVFDGNADLVAIS